MRSFEWSDPPTIEDALAQLRPGAVAKAGGVDLSDRLKERLDAPARLVNLRRIPALDGVRDAGGGLELGPLVTLARLADHPLVVQRFPAVAEAARRAATPNVRNQATVGGNLLQRPRCWYFRQADFPCRRKGGDTCFALEGRNQYHAVFANDLCAIVHPSDLATALVAHGAEVDVRSRSRARRLALEALYVLPDEDVTREHRVAPDELLVGIRLPAPAPGVRGAYVKIGERDSADWPIASAAAVLALDGAICRRATLVLGAAAPVPWRAREAEGALEGRRVDAAAAADAARAALAKARPLSENRYKVAVLEAALRRAILAAAGSAA
ncbi:FAD binding domain-containing protein [Anaeromyxobacter oryzae]|uniref:FAD-binding molybdopterin dehydrogenase n=1 Tax=Anaeromyxobacter oryzae TaxID=2918170 RepID=A0ABN6MQB2_9BACT|nr:FAD binding domain-containing protein [Anaeromyxobacter oryzae]BDG03192.1 FAD-binding molybdopterin dehydrogenase [Anaeromyxobacter oryzae]